MNTNNHLVKPGILQLLPSLMSGGVEREVIQLAELIGRSGYNSFVASAGGILVSQLYQVKARHFELPLNSKNPFVIWRNVKKLVEIIEKHNIEIIHAQSRAPAWSAYFAAKKTGCKFLTTVHGAHSIGNGFKRWYNSIMTRGLKVIAVSHFIADYLRDNYCFDEKKIEVVHCGTNLDYFNYEKIEQRRLFELAQKLRIPTDKPIILVPGRLSRRKGHISIIETIKKLRSNSVTCLIVGDDKGHFSYRQELQNLISSYNLSKRVIITSNVSDMPAMYALSDIVISASTLPESLGLISIEAQAMGRMTIATAIGGSKETIIDGQTGWLVEPGDVNGFKKAIEEALALDLPQRLYKAKLARNHVERHFSLDTMQEKMLYIYGSLLEQG